MGKYKYKIKEDFRVGDVKKQKGIQSRITDINPETGTISWDIKSIPAIDSTFEEFLDLRQYISTLADKTNDPVISDIKDQVLSLFKKYRKHIRDNYPDQYKKYQTNEIEVDEISTSSGSGGYLTKYAFRLPKNYKKVDENIGSTLGPGPKAGPQGVKDNYYVKKFKYKLVDRKKQAKSSKALDYKDLWNKTYK